jgi:hypothetical protein
VENQVIEPPTAPAQAPLVEKESIMEGIDPDEESEEDEPLPEQTKIDEESDEDETKPNPQLAEFKKQITGGSSESENDEDINELFQEKCKELLTLTIGNKNSAIYKGFIESESIVYAFFENSETTPLKTNSNMAILDEIQKRKIINTPIVDKISTMFDQNKILSNFKDEMGIILDNPICVYLCKKSGNNYVNVDIGDKPDTKTEILEYKINHPVFHDVYIFTTDPIPKEQSFFNLFSSPSKVKRFSLFIDNETVLKTEGDVTNTSNYNNFTCISFTENGRDYWAVRSELLFTEIL